MNLWYRSTNNKKNQLCNSLRIAEKTYYKNLLEKNKHNLSKLWNSLYWVINRKKKVQTNTTFKHNNKTISNNKEIASCFNNYFQNAASNLCKAIQKTSMDPCSYMPKNMTQANQ